jgi:hypothetical protein
MKQMELGGRLRDFVSQSLVEIVEGVLAARKSIEALGGRVATKEKMKTQSFTMPRESGSNVPMRKNAPTGEHLGIQETVVFDVAVTTREEVTGQAKTGIDIRVVSIGGKLSGGEMTEAVSRLQFSVPIEFPDAALTPAESPPVGQNQR